MRISCHWRKLCKLNIFQVRKQWYLQHHWSDKDLKGIVVTCESDMPLSKCRVTLILKRWNYFQNGDLSLNSIFSFSCLVRSKGEIGLGGNHQEFGVKYSPRGGFCSGGSSRQYGRNSLFAGLVWFGALELSRSADPSWREI